MKFPPRGATAEKQSLAVHMNKVGKLYDRKTVTPSKEAIKKVIDMVGLSVKRDRFDFTAETVWAKIDVYEETYNKDASPGAPFHILGSTKGAVMDEWGTDIKKVAFFRVMMRIFVFLVCKELGIKISDLSASQLFELGLMDPIRLMIKEEPHSLKKQLEGRFRIIWVCSIGDEMADKVCLELDKICIANWQFIPMKAGCPMGTATGDSNIVKFLMKHPHVKSRDVTNWDWLYNETNYRMGAIARFGVTNREWVDVYENDFGSENWYWAQLRMMVAVHMRKMIVFSDGTVYEQMFAGIGPSGNGGTTNNNNFGNMVVHAEVCVQLGVDRPAMLVYGDDAVTSANESIVEQEDGILESLGVYVKPESVRISKNSGTHHELEFCSRLYSYNEEKKLYKVKFLGLEKTLSSFLHGRLDDERLLGVEGVLGKNYRTWLERLIQLDKLGGGAQQKLQNKTLENG